MRRGKQWLTILAILGASALMYSAWEVFLTLIGQADDFQYVVTPIQPELFAPGTEEILQQ